LYLYDWIKFGLYLHCLAIRAPWGANLRNLLNSFCLFSNLEAMQHDNFTIYQVNGWIVFCRTYVPLLIVIYTKIIVVVDNKELETCIVKCFGNQLFFYFSAPLPLLWTIWFAQLQIYNYYLIFLFYSLLSNREMIFVQPFCDNLLTTFSLILTLYSYSLSSFFSLHWFWPMKKEKKEVVT